MGPYSSLDVDRADKRPSAPSSLSDSFMRAVSTIKAHYAFRKKWLLKRMSP